MDERIKYVVATGGLMRYCLQTLDEHMQAFVDTGKEPKEGDILHCKFHKDNGGMIFDNGAWRWNDTQ